jgi:flagellar biogenesis protein FliO
MLKLIVYLTASVVLVSVGMCGLAQTDTPNTPTVVAARLSRTSSLPVGMASAIDLTKSVASMKPTMDTSSKVIIAAPAKAKARVTPSVKPKPKVSVVPTKPLDKDADIPRPLLRLTATPQHAAEATQNRPDKVALLTAHEDKGGLSKEEGSPNFGWTAFLTVMKLGIVLVLAYVTILALKWFLNSKDPLPRIRRNLKVMDTAKLSSTCSVHVVAVGGKKLLLGCSTGQVSLLTELEVQEDSEPAPVQDSRFSEYLAKYSATAPQSGAAGRIAGLLRDATSHLKSKCQPGNTPTNGIGGSDAS